MNSMTDARRTRSRFKLAALLVLLPACSKPATESASAQLNAQRRARVSLVSDRVEGEIGFDPGSLVDGGNDFLYMSGWDRETGYELWRYGDIDTDPETADKFELVEDIYEDEEPIGLNSSYPTQLVNRGDDQIFFTARDEDHGVELWVHDTTGPTTSRVTDLYEGALSSYPHELTAINGTLYFAANSFNNTTGVSTGVEPFRCVSPGNVVSILADIFATSVATSGSSYPKGFTAIGTDVYFNALIPPTGLDVLAPIGEPDPSQGYEAHIWDGFTVAALSSNDSTEAALASSFRFSSISGPIDVEGVDTYYITPNDDGGGIGGFGLELWKFDPAALLAENLFDLVEDTIVGTNGLKPTIIGVTGEDSAAPDLLLLSGYPDFGDLRLYIYDTTAEEMRLLNETHFLSIGKAQAFDDKLYFNANDREHGEEMWVYNPADDTAKMLIDLKPGGGSSSPRSLTLFDDSLFFSADDGTHGRELWRHEAE
jgi:ELWxxDGT repeat protein